MRPLECIRSESRRILVKCNMGVARQYLRAGSGIHRCDSCAECRRGHCSAVVALDRISTSICARTCGNVPVAPARKTILARTERARNRTCCPVNGVPECAGDPYTIPEAFTAVEVTLPPAQAHGRDEKCIADTADGACGGCVGDHVEPTQGARGESRERCHYPKMDDRRDAGQRLAAKLVKYAGEPDLLVLALPRGGVPVAYEVAETLAAPLDVFPVRKLGVPGHDELAMGTIASGGIRVLNDDVIRALRLNDDAIGAVAAREWCTLRERELSYRGERFATPG